MDEVTARIIRVLDLHQQLFEKYKSNLDQLEGFVVKQNKVNETVTEILQKLNKK